MTDPRSNLAIEEELDETPFSVALVTDALRLFAKAARAHQLYLPNNPMHARAMDSVREGFLRLWKDADALELQITDSDIRWLGRPVIEEPGRTSDSLPWLFYKDGIRELTILPGFEDSELAVLFQLIQRSRLASAEDDDLLTLLWEHEFAFLQYRYVELAVDVGAPLVAHGPEVIGRIVSPREVETGPEESLASSSFARMDEYDSTLYFLDDGEIDYLQRAIADDFSSDLKTKVVASLLDTYEKESDPTVREEIAGILEQLFVVMLSLAQFRTAAYIMREAIVTSNRAPGILDSEKERLLALADRLSEPEALNQLFETLEELVLKPPQHDLLDLFSQLRPNALGSVLGWIGRSRNAELRALLESAGSRMAASHTAELVRLIGSEDDVVAFEAVRRAGSMKTAAAVQALAATVAHGSSDMRIAAINALAQIATPGAMAAVERALEDEDSDIRVAAVRVLASRGYAAAAPRIEGQLQTRTFKESSLAEKMAFFESYGTLCGDAGTALLSDILNARRLMRPRSPSELRACAAVALGKVGTDRALEALQRAGGDSDLIVRNAVSRAVRGG